LVRTQLSPRENTEQYSSLGSALVKEKNGCCGTWEEICIITAPSSETVSTKYGGNSHPSLERDLDPPLVGNESQRSSNRILIATVSGICFYPKCLPGELFECQNLPRRRKIGKC